jgi:hypothetical protein
MTRKKRTSLVIMAVRAHPRVSLGEAATPGWGGRRIVPGVRERVVEEHQSGATS